MPLGLPKIEKMVSTEFKTFNLKTESIKTKPIDYVPKELKEM